MLHTQRPGVGGSSHAPFGDAHFWEERYVKERKSTSTVEWYTDWEAMRLYVVPYLSETKKDRILQIGCGMSELAAALYRDGYKNVTSVDISESAIDFQKRKFGRWEGLQYQVADVTKLDAFPDQTFDVVIGKACIDSLFCSYSCVFAVQRALTEVHRLLKDGGRFFSISHGSNRTRYPHFTRPEFSWKCQVVTLSDQFQHYMYYCKRPTEEQLEQERKARLKLALKGERVLSVPCRFPAKEAAEAEEERKRAIVAAKKAYEEHARKRRQSMAAI